MTDASSWVLSLSCPDRSGIVHAVSGVLADHDGNITESQQFGDPDTGLFFMRVEFASAAPRAELDYDGTGRVIAQLYEILLDTPEIAPKVLERFAATLRQAN